MYFKTVFISIDILFLLVNVNTDFDKMKSYK